MTDSIQVCAASAWHEIVTAGLGNFTAWSVPPARPALSPGCRFQSGSASGKPSTSGREDSRLAMLSPSPASPRLLPWPPRPLGQLLGLPAAYRKHLTIAVHLPRSFFRLREAMQRGTPVGKERRYSWTPTAGRSEASSPPTTDLWGRPSALSSSLG